MPSPRDAVTQDKERRGMAGRTGSNAVTTPTVADPGRRRRRGIAVDINDAAGSYLSPTRLLSSFSGMGISKYREYLPNAETSGRESDSIKGEGHRASWQKCDLGDGQGRRPLLVITSPRHALQIFSVRQSVIPDDPHVQEVHPAPEEILSIMTLRDDLHYEPRQIPSASTPDRTVVCAKLVDRGPLCREYGPIALVVAGRKGRGTSYALSLEVLSLRSGTVVKKVDLSSGSHASLQISSRAVVVSIVQSSASLVILDPYTLLALSPPIEHLPVDPRTSLPVFILSGRLLAYTTSTLPARPGPEGLGSIVTSRTLRSRSKPQSSPLNRNAHSAQADSSSTQPNSQNVILNSAVEIGGGVARGVWAGLKMGAQAAGRAANQRLASSAPARGGLEIDANNGSPSLGSPEEATSESRSLTESSILDDIPMAEPDVGGQWIKIIDLCPSASSAHRQPPEPTTIAHFRLPCSRQVVPPINSHESLNAYSQSRYVSHLAFSPDGTGIFVSPADGRALHLFDIHPASPELPVPSGTVAGEVWHTYELRRGNTAAAVSEVQWSADGRWIGVATQRGTVHVFAINPSGGPTFAASHVPVRLPNPTRLHALSTIVTPSARIRPRQRPSQLDVEIIDSGASATFAFMQYRATPLRPGVSALDIALYRPAIGQFDLARLSVHGVQPASKDNAREADMGRRASALTEMMKTKVGMASSDLEVRAEIKATWHIPIGSEGASSDLCVDASPEKGNMKPAVPKSLKNHRAQIEIQTFTYNPQLLPSTIYLSHQIDFYDARPIDEYSRMSIMDREARIKRLHFRPAVEIHSVTDTTDVGAGPKSFDEPLTSALHSIIDSSPSFPLPGLPNGRGTGHPPWKASIPIRQVKEGALHLRREYTNRRSSRRRSNTHSITANALSFEEDTVFPSASLEDGESSTSPLSSGIPNTDAGVDDHDHDHDQDQDWNVKWEDEYERAVLDDGGPDDLVLGLMDEQQEERKRWVARQKRLAEQYAKDQ